MKDQITMDAKELLKYEYTETEKLQLQAEIKKLHHLLKSNSDIITLTDLLQIVS